MIRVWFIFHQISKLHVIRGIHLPPVSQEGKIFPMVMVKLCPNGTRFRAQSTKETATDPLFNKIFSFPVSFYDQEKNF